MYYNALYINENVWQHVPFTHPLSYFVSLPINSLKPELPFNLDLAQWLLEKQSLHKTC